MSNPKAEPSIDDLWRRQVELLAEAKLLVARIRAAEAQLPDWAQSGPIGIQQDGTFVGIQTGWPVMERLVLPDRPGLVFLARPSPSDIRRAFERRAKAEPHRRGELRMIYRRRVREAIARMRAKMIEEERVRLPALREAEEANFEQRWENRETIEALPPTPAAAVAFLLLDMSNGNDHTIALRHLRPSVTGLLAEHVDLVLNNSALSEVELPFIL
ncbi:MAG: hypothetical protein KIT48_12100 [Pseudolabrys sp.]|nr:hypothetical protein [Pseudolabrys sp.]